MNKKREMSATMRMLHRNLGFFLVGIMAVYAISGITLIFRDSDILKKENKFEKTVDKNLAKSELGKVLDIRRLKVERIEDDIFYFKEGTYNAKTGLAKYTKIEFPYLIKKLQRLHKARSADPLFFLNIFFGLSLLFFAISSFWMYMPGSSIFKKGMYFVFAGILFTLLLLSI